MSGHLGLEPVRCDAADMVSTGRGRLPWLLAPFRRRMLPLVQSFTVRGYGPEAPSVPLTPLRSDGWLSLELHQGLYKEPSQPPPEISLLENSGLCVSLEPWLDMGSCARIRRLGAILGRGACTVQVRAQLGFRHGTACVGARNSRFQTRTACIFLSDIDHHC